MVEIKKKLRLKIQLELCKIQHVHRGLQKHSLACIFTHSYKVYNPWQAVYKLTISAATPSWPSLILKEDKHWSILAFLGKVF